MEDILVLFNNRVNNIKREYASKYIYIFWAKGRSIYCKWNKGYSCAQNKWTCWKNLIKPISLKEVGAHSGACGCSVESLVIL